MSQNAVPTANRPTSTSVSLSFGTRVVRPRPNSPRPTPTPVSTLRVRCADTDVTGTLLARGKAMAMTPSASRSEMKPRSVRLRPHGGAMTSMTAQATKPMGGSSHRSAMAMTAAMPSPTRWPRGRGVTSTGMVITISGRPW